MRTAVICNSDALVIPAIHQLVQQSKLQGISILHRSGDILLPQLLNTGVLQAVILPLPENGRKQQLSDRPPKTSPAEVELENSYTPEPGTIVNAGEMYSLIVACRANQFLKINIAQFREAYFPGSKLFSMGIKTGEKFSSN